MAKQWTDDDIRAEIKEAVRIVNEDRERATYASLHEKYGQKAPENEGGEGGPPPPKEGEGNQSPQAKKSIWWPAGDEE